jgi:hypothetical protein
MIEGFDENTEHDVGDAGRRWASVPMMSMIPTRARAVLRAIHARDPDGWHVPMIVDRRLSPSERAALIIDLRELADVGLIKLMEVTPGSDPYVRLTDASRAIL